VPTKRHRSPPEARAWSLQLLPPLHPEVTANRPLPMAPPTEQAQARRRRGPCGPRHPSLQGRAWKSAPSLALPGMPVAAVGERTIGLYPFLWYLAALSAFFAWRSAWSEEIQGRSTSHHISTGWSRTAHSHRGEVSKLNRMMWPGGSLRREEWGDGVDRTDEWMKKQDRQRGHGSVDETVTLYLRPICSNLYVSAAKNTRNGRTSTDRYGGSSQGTTR